MKWCVLASSGGTETMPTTKVKTPKSELTWTVEEKLANVNSQALNAIFFAVDGQEFQRICKSTTSKWT